MCVSVIVYVPSPDRFQQFKNFVSVWFVVCLPTFANEMATMVGFPMRLKNNGGPTGVKNGKGQLQH